MAEKAGKKMPTKASKTTRRVAVATAVAAGALPTGVDKITHATTVCTPTTTSDDGGAGAAVAADAAGGSGSGAAADASDGSGVSTATRPSTGVRCSQDNGPTSMWIERYALRCIEDHGGTPCACDLASALASADASINAEGEGESDVAPPPGGWTIEAIRDMEEKRRARDLRAQQSRFVAFFRDGPWTSVQPRLEAWLVSESTITLMAKKGHAHFDVLPRPSPYNGAFSSALNTFDPTLFPINSREASSRRAFACRCTIPMFRTVYTHYNHLDFKCTIHDFHPFANGPLQLTLTVREK